MLVSEAIEILKRFPEDAQLVGNCVHDEMWYLWPVDFAKAYGANNMVVVYQKKGDPIDE